MTLQAAQICFEDHMWPVDRSFDSPDIDPIKIIYKLYIFQIFEMDSTGIQLNYLVCLNYKDDTILDCHCPQGGRNLSYSLKRKNVLRKLQIV